MKNLSKRSQFRFTDGLPLENFQSCRICPIFFSMSMCLTDCNNILMRRHWQSIQNSCSIDWVANYYARNKNHFCMQDIKLGFYAGRKAVWRAAGTYRGEGRNSPHKNVPRIEANPKNLVYNVPTKMLDIPAALDQFNQLAQSWWHIKWQKKWEKKWIVVVRTCCL